MNLITAGHLVLSKMSLKFGSVQSVITNYCSLKVLKYVKQSKTYKKTNVLTDFDDQCIDLNDIFSFFHLTR